MLLLLLLVFDDFLTKVDAAAATAIVVQVFVGADFYFVLNCPLCGVFKIRRKVG